MSTSISNPPPKEDKAQGHDTKKEEMKEDGNLMEGLEKYISPRRQALKRDDRGVSPERSPSHGTNKGKPFNLSAVNPMDDARYALNSTNDKEKKLEEANSGSMQNESKKEENKQDDSKMK